MTTMAVDLIAKIEHRGGRVSAENGALVIEPADAGLPFIESLREHKPAILAVLKRLQTDDSIANYRNPWRVWLDAHCAPFAPMVGWCERATSRLLRVGDRQRGHSMQPRHIRSTSRGVRVWGERSSGSAPRFRTRDAIRCRSPESVEARQLNHRGPRIGDIVARKGSCIRGTVVAVGNGKAHVMWSQYTRTWANIKDLRIRN
jgi:hypothetical protein